MRCLSLTALFWLGSASQLSAQLVDTLDTTFNFSGGFNGATATASGDGTVNLTRTQSGIDSGIDWRPGGDQFLSLAGEGQLTITPSASVNDGLWNVNILFWTSTGDFVTEALWLDDTFTLAPQSLDVGQFAFDMGVSPAATQYFVRFRIDPFTYSGGDPGFTFTEIVAVPEPSSTVLLLTAFSLFCLAVNRKIS